MGEQRVQRHPALAIPFGARDLRAAQTAGAVYADPPGAETLRRLHRTLHRTAEGDATFELIGNALADQLGVDLGLANLDDVQRHGAARQVAQLLAQLFDVGTLLADDDARTGGIDRHAAQLRRPLDHDLRDRDRKSVV